MNWKKRQYANALRIKDVNSEVHLCGWIDTIRDHGQILFMHIRDVSGVVQIVFDPEVNKEAYAVAETLRSEYVVSITGKVWERVGDAKNKNLPTGDIEIHVTDIELLTKAETPPFIITEKSQTEDSDKAFNVDEDLRLSYRYLDLRRPSMQQNILKRAELIHAMRVYMDSKGFKDIETPMLTKSTPEGARDYLVPSRHHQTKFYALPQSPQLFKQLLMMSGMDRYYQVVRCFRDEDLRPNRQPEFTQLDIEASFIDESFIYELMEGLVTELYKVVGKTVEGPFKRIPYAESMAKYGNDKPDLRFGCEMIDVSDVCKNVGYKIFQSIVSSGGLIKGINIKGHADKMSKSLLQEELAKKVVPSFGAKGMSWMKVIDGKLESNIVQFFSPEEQQALIKEMNGENGDVFLFVADANHHLVNDALGRLRLYVGNKFELIDRNKIECCWVTDFPMFELKDGNLNSLHHPFTQPDKNVMTAKTKEEFLTLKSRGYDLVINGEEVGGGSIRIHDPEVQSRIFEILGFNAEEIEEKFGFFVNALKYGTPPHGGIALGIDRLVAMILEQESIREVIAFPKNRVAFCPLTKAPSKVDDKQLEELSIQTLELEEDS